MRTLETLLLLANLLAMLVLAVPLHGAMRWLRLAAPAALLVAVAQVVAQGPRWQLVPAYVLAGLFFVVWLLNFGNAGAPTARKGLRRFAPAAGIGLGLLGLVVSIALPLVLPVFRFAPPGGPYAIGTLSYHWVDTGRREIFATSPQARRELVVQVWYPAKEGGSAPLAPYLPDAGALASAQARLHGLPEFSFGHLRYVTTNARVGIPVSDAEPSYPVLLFLEGLTGYRQMNNFQVEHLVSRGYVVVAIDQPYASAAVVFPDGRQVAGLSKQQLEPLIQHSLAPAAPDPTLDGRSYPDSVIAYLARDATFVLDQLVAVNRADPNGILATRLDLQRAGAFGVSLGGIVVGEACRLEPRLRACLVMDAPMPFDVVQAGLRQPAMWITRDAATMQQEGWSLVDIDQHQTSMRSVFEGLPGDGYFVRVRGMFHANLMDIPYFSPLMSWLGVTGPIDAQRAYAIVNVYSEAFFDRHLRGRAASLLDGPASPYPEVLFESRRP